MASTGIIGEERKQKDLSPELLEMTIEKVCLVEKILSLPLVCKSWHKLVRSLQYWKSLNFQQLVGIQEHYSFIDRYSFSGLLKMLANLGGAAVQDQLVFGQLNPVTAEDLAYTAKKYPEVMKTLALRGKLGSAESGVN